MQLTCTLHSAGGCPRCHTSLPTSWLQVWAPQDEQSVNNMKAHRPLMQQCTSWGPADNDCDMTRRRAGCARRKFHSQEVHAAQLSPIRLGSPFRPSAPLDRLPFAAVRMSATDPRPNTLRFRELGAFQQLDGSVVHISIRFVDSMTERGRGAARFKLAA